MRYEDLSVFDLNLIKSNAAYFMISKKGWNRYNCLSEAVLDCIRSKGFNLSNPVDIKWLSTNLEPAWTFGIQSTTPSSDELILKIFNILIQNNVVILKDETREPTWSKLTDRHYNKYDDLKKPWVI